MKKFDRFDFEQQIMSCWNVTSDIRTVTEYLLDAPLEADREDKIANMLMGIEALYQAKFDKQKFAELIVKECVHWIDGSPSLEDGTLILGKHAIIDHIKGHFGVE